MKKLILVLFIHLFVFFSSCNTKNNNSQLENKLLPNAQKFCSDVDLFTFIPIYCSSNTNPKMVFKDGHSIKTITIYDGKNTYIREYIRNSKGYYSETVVTNSEEGNPGYLTLEYRVYSKNKIITFNVDKQAGVDKMNLHNYYVLYPVNENFEQFEYEYNDLSGQKISSFDEINFESILNKSVEKDFTSKEIYKFDYEKKIRYWYSFNNDKNILNDIYSIGNSVSIASPTYNTWKLLKDYN